MKLIILCFAVIIAADNDQKFTSDLYKELAKANKGNFVISPLSLQILLNLVYLGAKHETANQLASVLPLYDDPESLIKNVEVTSTSFVSTILNKIYVFDDFEINSTFKTIATDIFKAEIEKIDFKNTDFAVSQINDWVAKNTKDNVLNFVNSNNLPEDTIALLINTLYMEGTWDNMFTSVTRQKFYTDNVNYNEIEMMEQKKIFAYNESSTLNAKILKMKYRQSKFALIIVLPNSRTGLNSLEVELLEALKEPTYINANVVLKVPKFKMNYGIEFIPILRNMGVHDLFNNNADLTNIGRSNLYVSQLVQKNYIDVNENGTTASSATRIMGKMGAPKVQQKEFIADHPFLFYIQSPAGIVFLGRFTGN